jgi:hypothetical protein
MQRGLGQAPKSAAMKYMVMTTKRHAGLCHFDPRLTNNTAPQDACGRNLVREYWMRRAPKECGSLLLFLDGLAVPRLSHL